MDSTGNLDFGVFGVPIDLSILGTSDSTHHMIALTRLVDRNDINLIRDYLIANPNIHFNNTSCIMRPLYTALINENLDIVDLLLEHGANIDEQSARCDGSTGLFYAILHNKLDLIKFCIERGANINKFNYYGRTPLMEACFCFRQNNFETIQFLIENGVNINIQNYNNESALTYSVSSLNIELVNLLLANGANLPSDEFINSIVDEYGKRFVNIQLYLKHYKLLKILYIFSNIGINLDSDNIDMLGEFL